MIPETGTYFFARHSVVDFVETDASERDSQKPFRVGFVLGFGKEMLRTSCYNEL